MRGLDEAEKKWWNGNLPQVGMIHKNWSHHLSYASLWCHVFRLWMSQRTRIPANSRTSTFFPRFGHCRSGGHEILCATTNICTTQLWCPILTNQVASKDSSHPWKNKNLALKICDFLPPFNLAWAEILSYLPRFDTCCKLEALWTWPCCSDNP